MPRKVGSWKVKDHFNSLDTSKFKDIPEIMKPILEKFQSVFSELKALPEHRPGFDFKIDLKPEVRLPAKGQPYRKFPEAQRQERERVSEYLAKG